ncbi:MAG TPA: VWA domain-containing protein [Vicinamibacterales bacterium]
MTRHRCDIASERGYALIYMTFTLTVLLLFSGLAVDTGRAYVVRAQLSKAVDGAALGAARNLNSGDPRGEARRIFKANFPDGYLGTTFVTDPTTDPGFFKLETIHADGVNVVTVAATAKLPTTFMSLADFDEVTVSSSGEATRRMVDLSLVLDVSSSIGGRWPAVRDAARTFVQSFDANNDRLALVTFGSGAKVLDQMPSSRGFDKSKVVSDIPNALPGGSTAMVEGLYRGWDELRSVPSGQQSGLRVIVLFTDGASNSVPGLYDAWPTQARGLRTADFPKRFPDPDNQTHDNPSIAGLFDTQTGVTGPNYSITPPNWSSPTTLMQVQYLPLNSFHGYRRSAGIPSSFPLQSSTLKVNGVPQSTKRGLRNKDVTTNRYPADVWNINNASRNLVEIIANAARSDNGDYRIRIYTIGMGELVRLDLGTMPEKPEQILMRMANDSRSLDFNKDQLEGKYYYAETGADVGPAFQALQNQIVRLTK